MAFFGIEVKPAKPFTHSSNSEKGRLRISQATLGIGSATKKSWVQCNVGNMSPVLLCVLIPDKTESCQLDLEFDEAEDVVFSVIGPRSVFLTGYYVSNSRKYNMNSDTESFGEDVGNSESEKSNHCSDEDTYEDSFIDDDEPEVSPPSSSEEDDTKMQEGKVNGGKGNPKRLQKRYQVIESDDGTSLEDSEDNYLLSVFKSKRVAKTVSTKTAENTGKLAVTTGGKGIESKEVTKAVNLNSEPASEGGNVNFDKPKKKRKERSKDAKILESESGDHKQVKVEHTEGECGGIHQDLPINHDKRNTFTNMDKFVAPKKLEIDPDLYLSRETDDCPTKLDAESGPKSKKRRKELEGVSVEGNHAKSDVSKGEQVQQDIVKAGVDKDKTVKAEVDEILNGNLGIKVKADAVADACLAENKSKTKKKKKSKTPGNEGHLNKAVPVTDKSAMGEGKFLNYENNNAASSVARTLSNGLIIEELAKGEPDGKVAAPGKKVKIYYTAMLKESGHVFDSNVGKSPCKFRLGNEKIIEGWNLGIDGMHIGDKRRLIIPPSMGYGNQGAGENVPPDSWLVYDVELVGLH